MGNLNCKKKKSSVIEPIIKPIILDTIPEDNSSNKHHSDSSHKHPDDKHQDDKHFDDKHVDDKHPDNKHPDDKHVDDKHHDDKHPDNKHPDDKHHDDKHPDDKHHLDDIHLDDKHDDKTHPDDKQYSVEDKTDLEEEILNSIVESYLKDEHMNIHFMPDFIERRLYKNMLRILIGVLKNTATTTSMDIFDHHITFNVQPKAI